jgi:hypothetical protein
MPNKHVAKVIRPRKHPRYAVPWRIVIVYKRHGKQESYHGSICDLSLGGVTVFVDHIIHSSEPVVATIEIPGVVSGQRTNVVGVRCNITHSILSANYGKFKLGMQFIEFNGKSKDVLMDALANRMSIRDTSQPYVLPPC